MNVVCKMRCHEAPENPSEAPEKVRLGAVWEPDEAKRELPENALFGKATPWGEIVLGIANPDAKRFFRPGKSYYVTFSEAQD